MNNLIIVGAGDFGREVSWVVERINAVEPTWNLLGFIDDNPARQGRNLDGYPVLGTRKYLLEFEEEIYVVCSIGTGRVRKKVMDELACYAHIHLATLIDPDAIVGRNAVIEEGCVVCAGTVLTISARIKKNTLINLNCTVGHDTILGECCTVSPGSNISGKVETGDCVDFGTGSKVIQGKTICSKVTLGAGAVVVKDIVESGTYVGTPARRLGDKML